MVDGRRVIATTRLDSIGKIQIIRARTITTPALGRHSFCTNMLLNNTYDGEEFLGYTTVDREEAQQGLRSETVRASSIELVETPPTVQASL